LLPTPARHSFLTITSFIILLASLSKDFLIKVKREVQYFFIVLLCLLFFMEYFPLYYDGYYNVEIPQMIYNMAQQKEFFTVLNIPHKNTQGMYLQTIHNKESLDGLVSRIGVNSTTILKKIGNFIENNETVEIEKIFKENRVRYIIVNYNYDPIHYEFSFLKLLELLNSSLKSTEKTYSLEIYELKTY